MSDELEREEERIAALFGEVQAPASMRRWESGAASGLRVRRGIAARLVAALVGWPGERRLRPLAAALVVPLLVLVVGGGMGLRAHFAGVSGSAGDPPARSGAAMAFDADHGVVVMFGGQDRQQVLGDTWVWDGSGWFEQHPAHSPSARAGAAMAFDAGHHRVLLYGGEGFRQMGGSITESDTWAWDGSDWHLLSTAHTPELFVHGMGFDPATGQLLLVGYGLANLPPQPLPRPVLQGGTATRVPLPGGHGVVIGTVTAPPTSLLTNPNHEALQTWVWTGSGWAQRSPRTSPVGASGQLSPAWDAAANGLVLVTSQESAMAGAACTTGCVTSREWRWDGGNWAELKPAGGFAPTALVADPASGSAIGVTTGSTYRDDGSQWRRTVNPTGLLNRRGFALAADTARDQVVLFGGDSPHGAAADTWTWDGHTWTHRAGPVPDSRPLPVPSFSAPPLPSGCPIEGLPQIDVTRPVGSAATLITLHFVSPVACGHLIVDVVDPDGQPENVLHNPLAITTAQSEAELLWRNWCGAQAVEVHVSNPFMHASTLVHLRPDQLPACTDRSQPSTLAVAHPAG